MQAEASWTICYTSRSSRCRTRVASFPATSVERILSTQSAHRVYELIHDAQIQHSPLKRKPCGCRCCLVAAAARCSHV
jgi:hypothetical protein